MAYNVPDALLQTLLASAGRGAPSVASGIILVDRGSTQPTEDGSLSSPFKTITAALATLTPQAFPSADVIPVIWIAGGYYDEALTIPDVGAVVFLALGPVFIGNPAVVHPSPTVRDITYTTAGAAFLTSLSFVPGTPGAVFVLTGDLIFDDGGTGTNMTLNVDEFSFATTGEFRTSGGHLGNVTLNAKNTIFGTVNAPTLDIGDIRACVFEGDVTILGLRDVYDSRFNGAVTVSGDIGYVYNTRFGAQPVAVGTFSSIQGCEFADNFTATAVAVANVRINDTLISGDLSLAGIGAVESLENLNVQRTSTFADVNRISDCYFGDLVTIGSWSQMTNVELANGILCSANGGRMFSCTLSAQFEGIVATTFSVDATTNASIVSGGLNPPAGGATKTILHDLTP